MEHQPEGIKRAAPEDLKRCFIALKPDSSSIQYLSSLPVPAGWRQTFPEDLHLTVAFLGGIRPEQAQALHATLATAPVHLPPMQAQAMELWPSPQRARVFVLKLKPTRELGELVEHVTSGLLRLALPLEYRPYRPHVTLARAAHHDNTRATWKPAPDAGAAASVMPSTAGAGADGQLLRFVTLGLFGSVTGPVHGPRYRTIHAFDLN